jgi:toxin ParE1/3/4
VKAANNPATSRMTGIYQSIDHIRPGYRRCRCGGDHIYYRIQGNKVQIMAIIGAQDLQYWLG